VNRDSDAKVIASGRSCVVLGAGRSGTSLVAGLLASGGHFVGSKLLPASELNPRGFFEDAHVNRINEQLLAQMTDGGVLRRPKVEKRFSDGQRWLSALPPDCRFFVGPFTALRMMRITRSGTPFCLKDPRFCYTLEAWRPYLQGARVVCVFREPGRTATSMLRAVEVDRGLHGFDLTLESALQVWRCMYESALHKSDRDKAPWLFLHYDDLLETAGISRLERFLEVEIDRNFVKPELKRSVDVPVDPLVQSLYLRLCALAERDSR
jgi:hypothetical protein